MSLSICLSNDIDAPEALTRNESVHSNAKQDLAGGSSGQTTFEGHPYCNGIHIELSDPSLTFRLDHDNDFVDYFSYSTLGAPAMSSSATSINIRSPYLNNILSISCQDGHVLTVQDVLDGINKHHKSDRQHWMDTTFGFWSSFLNQLRGKHIRFLMLPRRQCVFYGLSVKKEQGAGPSECTLMMKSRPTRAESGNKRSGKIEESNRSVTIPLISNIYSDDGKELFNINCIIDVVTHNEGTSNWKSDPVLEVKLSQLHMTTSSDDYTLDLCQVKIQASLPHFCLANIVGFFPKAIHAVEESKTKEERRRAFNATIQASTNSGIQMGAEQSSINSKKQTHNLWELRTFSQEESNDQCHNYIAQWKYIHNLKCNPVHDEEFVERRTLFLGYNKHDFLLPILKGEIMILWSASPPKSQMWKRPCLAKLNFLQCASLEVDLGSLSQSDIKAYRARCHDPLPTPGTPTLPKPPPQPPQARTATQPTPSAAPGHHQPSPPVNATSHCHLWHPQPSPAITVHHHHSHHHLWHPPAITAMIATSAPGLSYHTTHSCHISAGTTCHPWPVPGPPSHIMITHHCRPNPRTACPTPAPPSPPHYRMSLCFQCKTSTPRDMSQPHPTPCGPWVSPQAPVPRPATGTQA